MGENSISLIDCIEKGGLKNDLCLMKIHENDKMKPSLKK